MKKLILAIAIFLGASPLWAELMTYQGRLKESNVPVTGNRLFTFEFCDAEDGSGFCLVAPNTPASFAVANGLFKSTITIHPNVDLAAGAWYLRVTVGSSLLTPLERLTAVPYSVFASSAGYASYAAGTVQKAGDTMTGPLTLDGSTLTVTGNEFSVGGSTFVVKNGYVGMGTDAPAARLHVVSDNGYVHMASPGSDLILNLVPQTYGTASINNNGNGPIVLSVANNEYLRVARDGNIGISSATPSYRLSVSSGAGETGTIMAVSTGTSNLFWVAGDGAHAVKFYGDGSGLSGVTGATDNTKVLKTGDTMSGHLMMAGASTITVAGSSFSVGASTFSVTNGRVGIGTASPALALDVQLPAGVQSEGIRVTARSAIRLDLNSNQADTTARNWSLLSNNPRFGDFSIRRSISMGGDANSSGATAIYLAREGNVGFSDDLPLYRLHVSSGAGEAGTIMAVSTGTSNLFWVAGDGAHATKFVGDGSGLTGVTGATGTDPNALQLIGGTLTGPLQILSDDLANDTSDFITTGLVISTGGAIQTTGLGHGTVAGDARGPGAVDLQTFRTAVTEVSSADYSVIGGGRENTAGGVGASVAGGRNNNASSQYSAIAGGQNNLTNGNHAFVSGGYGNQANGHNSWAGGTVARVGASGSFVWADSQGGVYAMDNNIADSVVFKARGGFLVTGSTNTTMTGSLDRGVIVTGNGLLGVATSVPQAALDVVSTGTASNVYAQIWRDANGTIVASMTAAGAFTSLQPLDGDDLGNHNAGQDLQLNWHNIYTVSTITAAGHVTAAAYQINGSTVLALGSVAPKSLFVGADAGKNNTGSTFNTLVGNGAGWGGSGADFNRVTAVGTQAGISLVSGSYNSLLGVAAGYMMDTGANNTVVGALAAYGDTSGSNNVVVGQRAGYFTSTGSSNTLVGDYAGYGASNNSFSDNSVLGANAGYSLTTGSRNILIGVDAGKNISGGSDNLVIGNAQGPSSPAAVSELNIGGLIFGHIGAKTVGISTRAPQAALDIVSTGTGAGYYAQIWRDGTGLVVSSVSSQGVFYGNGSGLTGVTAVGAVQKAGDTMNGALNMNGNFLAGVSTITMQGGSIAIVPPGTPGSNAGYGISIGSSSYNNYTSGLGLGHSAVANYNYGVGLGYSASNNYASGVGVGNASNNNYTSGVGVGNSSFQNHDYGVGVGYNAGNNYNYGLGLGANANTNYDYGVGLGAYAQNNDSYAVGVGAYSQNNAGYGAALGAYSYASSSATALGAQAKANAELSLALGYGTVNNSTGTASFGNYGVYTSTAVNAAYYQVSGSTVLAIRSGSLAVGSGAGRQNTGLENVFVGTQAGENTLAGDYNVFLGYQTGLSNTLGYENAFLGVRAGRSNTTGQDNTLVGALAGSLNQTGSANSAFGYSAGYGVASNSFSSATLVGYKAGTALTTGSDNILVGFQAGDSVTTGGRNIVIGYDQDTSVPGAGSELNIGGVIFGSLNQRTIGISTRAPQAALDVVSTGTGAGFYAQIWRDSTGLIVSSVNSQGVFYGNGSGLTGIAASDATKLPLAGGNMTGQLTTASTVTVQGNAFSVGASTFVVNAGRVGINWITPEAALQVSGGAKFLSSPDTSYVLTAGTSLSPYRFFVSSGGAVGMGDFNGVNVDTASVVHILSKLTSVNDGAEDVRVGLFVESNTDGTMDPNDLLVSANLEATVQDADSPSLVSPLRLKVRRENTPSGTVDRAIGLFIDDIQNNIGGAITNTYGIFIGDQTSGTQTNQAFALFSADANARTYYAGSVGIAYMAPEARLDLAADSSGANSMGQIWRNSGGTIVSSMSATGVMMAAKFIGDGSGLFGLSGVQKTGDTMTGALTISGSSLTIRPAVSDAYSLYISSADGSTPAFTVRPGGQLYTAGRVGIGALSPTEALDISGRVQISTRAGGNDSTDGLISFGSNGMAFQSGGNTYMRVANGGNYIGIGPSTSVDSTTNSPSLQVKNNMSVGSTYNSSKPPANSLVVEGRLGVGTPAPDAALSVVQSNVAVSSYTVHIGTSSTAYHLVVTTAGWLGLNTQRPQAPLHLTAATKDEGIIVEHNSSTSEGSYLALLKARGSASMQSLVAEGDNLGVLAFGGYNGTSGDPFPMAAAIVGRVDGAPTLSAPDMPGRLEFMTAADNTNETVTRMVIRNDGGVGIATGTPQAMLDILSTSTVAQVWRDAGGVVRASMTASGVLYAQVDAVSSKVSKTGDNMSGGLTITVNPSAFIYDFATTGIQVSTAGSITTIGAGNGSSGAGVRGMGAVDLQTARTTGGQVAQGVFSTLGGGAYNTILGSNTVVAGGRYNIAAGTSAVISGGEGNYAGSLFSTIGGGKSNSANGSNSAVFAGEGNMADEMFSLVGGGYSNTANTSYSVVAGGSGNEAGVSGGDGQGSFIGGGQNNNVRQNYGAIAGGMNNLVGDFADYAFVGAGYENEANGTHSAVAGGWWNVAGGMDSFIGGGMGNVAAGSYSAAVGGSSNTAQGEYSAAVGGSSNTAQGKYSSVVGGSTNTVASDYGAIGGGSRNSIYHIYGVIGGGYWNTVNAAASYGFIGGGDRNIVKQTYGTIVGGIQNEVGDSGNYSFVGAGYLNKVLQPRSVIVGGWQNDINGADAFIGGGSDNAVDGNGGTIVGGSANILTAEAIGAFIGGGANNTSTGTYSSISGGLYNVANADYAVVPGGRDNVAKGRYSFAAGYKSSSTADGTFTWADSQGVVVQNAVQDQVMFKAAGGFWVSTGTVYTDPGLYVSPVNKVGIGTSAPGFKLHVKDTFGGAIAGLTNSSNGTDAAVYGWANNGATAIKGVSGSGYAGRFEGNVLITDSGTNPANPAKLQVNGDLGLGNGLQDGNTPIVIWLTASTPYVDGDVVVVSGNYQFGTTSVMSTSTVMGVAMGSGGPGGTGKIAVVGVVTANCINGYRGEHAITSTTPGSVTSSDLPDSGASVGLFLTSCGNPVTGKARLLLK